MCIFFIKYLQLCLEVFSQIGTRTLRISSVIVYINKHIGSQTGVISKKVTCVKKLSLQLIQVRTKTPFFYKGPNFCTKFDPINDFFKRRTSYYFKALEFRNLQAFEFFQLLNKNMFNGTLQIGFFIGISHNFGQKSKFG